MKSNVMMLKAEALLRFALYTSPDRKHAVPIGKDSWVDRETALGQQFAVGTEHEITSFEEHHESGRYIVAMLPLIRRVAHPRGTNTSVVHVTVYLAKADELPLFERIEQLTLPAIREAMLCLDEQ